MIVNTKLHAQLIQHLDATVASSIVLSGANIQSWNDQSGNGNNAIQENGNVIYSTSSNPSWIDFGATRNSLELFSSVDSKSWLDQSSSPNGFCVLIAFKADAILDTNWNDLIGNSSNISSGFGLRYSAAGVPQCYLGGQQPSDMSAATISPGDKVVFAFNYNASSGTYEIWVSKNSTSYTGSVSAADFSTVNPVSIGSMNFAGRYIKGGIGEVKIYNTALSPTEFETQRVNMATKWAGYVKPISINWRVIPEDFNYPTNDIIIAAVSLDDTGFASPLPANTANEDCTATFQEALDVVASGGGGTVFVPAGTYRIEGNLTINNNTILRGRWREITSSQPASGTILAIYPTTTNSTIYLGGHGCGARDLTFWHPNQNPSSPTEDPFVFTGISRQVTLENLTFVNAYQGINMTNSNMCCLRGIYGSPLIIGVTADRSAMVSRYENFNFSPEYWSWSGLSGSPALSGPHKTYIRNNGVGVDIREMDDFYFMSARIKGYNTGVTFMNGVSGDDPWGSLSDINTEDCGNGLYVVNSKFLKISHCDFQGDTYGVYGGDDPSIDLTLTSSTINGGTNSIKLNNESSQIKVVNCSVTGTTSDANGNEIAVSTHPEVAPIYNESYDKVRKPQKTDMFNVLDYGAIADGTTDATTSVQNAVNAAKANGGGIVFFPDGRYLMTGNLDLGAGVEIRGTSGGRHVASNRVLPFAEEEGSLIMIDVGKNQPNGTPFITMGDNSGIRGIGFHYVDQSIYNFIPYPFMIQANGIKNYIIDCSSSNPYQAAELNGDDHLVEYTFFGGLKSTFVANNCDGGRIQNLHIKPDFWGDIFIDDLPRTDRTTYDLNASKTLEAIYLNNCTNYTIYSIYSQYGKAFITVDNSGGQAIMVGAERFQNGYIFKNGSRNFDCSLTATTINGVGDGTGKNGIKTAAGFNGSANFFSSTLWGYAEETVNAQDGNLHLQGLGFGGFADRGAVNIICDAEATLSMNSSRSDLFLGYDIQGDFTMDSSYFPEGMLKSKASDYKENNKFDKVYLLADINQETPNFYGLELDMSNIVMEEITQSDFGDRTDARRYYAAKLSSGNSYKLNVTDIDFIDGKSPNVTVEIYLASDVNSTITIKYHATDGTMKTARITDYNYAGTIGQRATSVTLSDAFFGSAVNEDIVIEVSGAVGESPYLNYVSISKDFDSALSLNNIISQKSILYPNPATDIINISNVIAPVNYKVVNLLGRTVLFGVMDNNFLNVSKLKQGIYFLKLDNNQPIKFLKK